ncbi:hypothetical protein PDJAM_G00021090 [Pangasius djambal]|uniref:Uncharacterized protein n=1 Tax=Pangasius djambal TaxID=1691987 RepID=A0ACC5YNH2_9TELE|nr:hypothetical protein [Pangasius djambal]
MATLGPWLPRRRLFHFSDGSSPKRLLFFHRWKQSRYKPPSTSTTAFESEPGVDSTQQGKSSLSWPGFQRSQS